MSQIIADKDYFMTADRTRVVDEGSAEAAFLLARAGSPISPIDAAKYGITGAFAPGPDAVSPAEAKPGGDLDAFGMTSAAPGVTTDEKALPRADTKMLSKAPATKGF